MRLYIEFVKKGEGSLNWNDEEEEIRRQREEEAGEAARQWVFS